MGRGSSAGRMFPVETATGSVSSRREQRGWSWYDWAASAYSTLVVSVFLGPYLTEVANSAAAAGEQVTLFGLVAVAPGSYYPYIVSMSVLLQVVFMPIVGSIADVSTSKKRVMGIAAFVGAFATMSLFFVHDAHYQLGGMLFIVANVAYGCAFSVYNSFLPDIASAEERDAVSARAWAMGYVAGLIVLVIALALVLGHDALGIGTRTAARFALLLAGVWWAVFTLVPMRRLRDLPPTTAASSGMTQLLSTLRDLPKYPMALLFLVAFMFYNDGIQTAVSMTAVYAVEELKLTTTVVLVAVLILQFFGIFGALGMARLANRYGAKRVVLLSLGVWTLLTFAAYLLPVGKIAPFLAVGAAIGLVLGGTQALSRALFAQLAPQHRRAAYFSLYEVSNGASAVFGPLVFGLSLGLLDSYRAAILMLVLFFTVGGVVLSRVDVIRGLREATS